MIARHEEGRLVRRTTKGPALYFNACLPRDSPDVVVALVHGYADYSARFAHVMDAWAERGVATVAIDMRGHGRAEGPRGFCERFDDYLDDIAELKHVVDAQVPTAPRFLFGHSFGGLVAAASAIADRSSWRGLVLSAPYFRVALSISPTARFAGKVASMIAPSTCSKAIPRTRAAGTGKHAVRCRQRARCAKRSRVCAPQFAPWVIEPERPGEVARYLPLRSRWLQPGQQQGRRWPSSSHLHQRRAHELQGLVGSGPRAVSSGWHQV
jgi:alpha-beta hydrolase superfamily lysophospholipase